MRVLVVDDRKVASFIQVGSRGRLCRRRPPRRIGSGGTGGCIDYDAAVLDLMLPAGRDSRCCATFARKGDLPVLILTAKDSLEERVAGLDGGADDYMVKPFALAELSARLRALLRRGAPRETELRVADLEMDTIRRKVRRGGGRSISSRRSTRCSSS